MRLLVVRITADAKLYKHILATEFFQRRTLGYEDTCDWTIRYLLTDVFSCTRKEPRNLSDRIQETRSVPDVPLIIFSKVDP